MSNYEDRLSKISGIVVPLSADEERKQREDPACILPMDYHLFLVNEGDHDVTDVAMYTGGFGGSDGPHIELNRITKPLGELKRGGAIQIEDLRFCSLVSFGVNFCRSSRSTSQPSDASATR